MNATDWQVEIKCTPWWSGEGLRSSVCVVLLLFWDMSRLGAWEYPGNIQGTSREYLEEENHSITRVQMFRSGFYRDF
jgi:hypothetical protein